MKAVYDEVNGHLAVFIVEDNQKTYHKRKEALPADAKVGDVYKVSVSGDTITLLEKLTDERDARLQSARAKREELLKRKKLP